MNRQQRRADGRTSEKNPTYTITRDGLKGIINKEIDDKIGTVRMKMARRTVHDLTAAFAISLNAECGFGKKRLSDVLRRVQTTFACITAGTVTIEDIKNWCASQGIQYKDIFGGRDEED